MQTNQTQARVAVVTGGAMGIGEEVCRRLGAAGFVVVVADRDEPAAEKTAAELRANGAAAEAQVIDVGDAASVDRAFAAIEQRHGRCDVLVNSAGIAKVYPFLEFPDDNFAATMAVNVNGTFLCGQRAARLMVRNQWGRIVNIASVAGMRAVGTGRTAYLPFIASDFKQVDAIFYNPKGVLQTTLRETLAKQNIETLGFFELEFRAVTNSSKPIEKPADLKGLKLRVPGSAAIKGFFEEAGTQVVVMPFPELFTALQQKTVDGQDNGASITYESRLFETQKHMTLTNHVYAMGTVASSSKFWGTLSDAEKKILTDTAAEVTKKQIEKNRQLNAEFLKKIEAGGIKIVRPSAQAMAEFEKVGQAVWTKLSGTYGADRIAALRQEAAAARK